MAYDYSQFYKTKSPTGYDIFKSGGQKLAYEEALPMFKSGFNVEFIKEGTPQSGGIGAGVPIGQSAAVSAQQAGLQGIPTGGVAGAPTFATPVAPASEPMFQQGFNAAFIPTTPVKIDPSPTITSDTLKSLSEQPRTTSDIYTIFGEQQKRYVQQQSDLQKEIAKQQQEYQQAMIPTQEELTTQQQMINVQNQLDQLVLQKEKTSQAFEPSTYLKTEKGLQDVGISEAQLQRRVAAEQAPIMQSYATQGLSLTQELIARQRELGFQVGKRESLVERAKTALGFKQDELKQLQAIEDNNLKMVNFVLDYTSKIEENARRSFSEVVKRLDGIDPKTLTPQDEQTLQNISKQSGFDYSTLKLALEAQHQQKLTKERKDEVTTINNLAQKYPDAGISTKDTLESAQMKVVAKSKIYAKEVAGKGGGDGLTNVQIDNARAVASSFENSPIVKNFLEIQDRFLNAKTYTGRGDGATDIATIYDLMKVLDPTSVVREAEYDTGASKSGNIFAGALARFNGLIDPAGGFVSKQAKDNIFRVITDRYNTRKAVYDNFSKQKQAEAEAAAPGYKLTDYASVNVGGETPTGDLSPLSNQEFLQSIPTFGPPASAQIDNKSFFGGIYNWLTGK